MAMNVNRTYSTYLLFYDHTYKDYNPTAQKALVVHGGGDGYQLDLERMESRFNDLCQTVNRRTMTLLDANTYLQYNGTMNTSSTKYYTIAFWIYLPQSSFDVLSEIKERYIPILKWDDSSGHTVKVNIAEQIKDLDYNIAMTIDYSGYKKIVIPYTWTPNQWMHVLFNRDGVEGLDRIFINGRKLIETHIDISKVNKHIFHNLQLGNMYSVNESGIYQYSIDEFFICNDLFVTSDFPAPQTYMMWLYPESNHIETDPDSTIYNPVYGAPGFYNADKSRWDVVMDHLEITRPVYWKLPEDAKLKAASKLDFDTFHYAHSNFDYKDKNKIKDITPY